MSNVKGIAHVAIQAENFQKVLFFYINALDFKIIHEWSLPEFNLKNGAMLKSNDGHTMIEIFDKEAVIATQGRKRKENEAVVSGALLHLAFNVNDVNEAYEKALSYGATKCIEPSIVMLGDNMPVKNALVYSPNGEVIEFINETIF